MKIEDIKQKLKNEENITFVSKIKYKDKEYIKTIKILENGIDYIYYEIDNDEIKDIKNPEVIQYLKKHNEIKKGSICY